MSVKLLILSGPLPSHLAYSLVEIRPGAPLGGGLPARRAVHPFGLIAARHSPSGFLVILPGTPVMSTTQAEAAEIARAETAEQVREAIMGELQAAETATTQARAEAKRFQEMPGPRDQVVRWLAVTQKDKL